MTVGINVYSHIKRTFPSVKIYKEGMGFYRNKCKLTINESDGDYLVTFLITHVSKVTYLNIEVEGKSKSITLTDCWNFLE